LTRDHAEDDGSSAKSHFITRAVGGAEDLQLDIIHGEVRDGDRYLLCSDGLYTEVAVEQLIAALSQDDPQQACGRLRDAALIGRAPDNLTAVVVHAASSPTPEAVAGR